MQDSYDVVIIGGGHNGLVAGTYLRRAGRRVVVLERTGAPGGMARSDPVIPEAPGHMINTGAIELIHVRGGNLVDDLGLERHGYRTVDTDPSYAYLDPGGASVALFRDPRRTAEDMARLNPPDGKAYLEFVELLDCLFDIARPMMAHDPGRLPTSALLKAIGAAVRNRRLKRELTELTSGTADQIASGRFEHPAALGLVLGIVSGAGPIDVDGNAVAYLLLVLLHRLGVGKPVGGMRMLADALTAAYREAGGDLEVYAEVAEILIQDGRARGVRLKDGRLVSAAAVVSTCDPRTAFALVAPGTIDRRTRTLVEHAPANRANVGPILLNVALSGGLSLRRHQDIRHDDADLNRAVGMIGTPDEIRASLLAARRASVPEPPVLSVSPVTNWDPTQAPPGQSTAYLYLPVSPVQLSGGWDAHRQNMSNAIIARAAMYYDGFDAEIGRHFETCLDRAERLNVTNGCVTHVDFGSYRSGKKRPAAGLGGAEPVIPGFFLSGAGTPPGGGVSGMPGRFAADRVQRWLGRAGRG